MAPNNSGGARMSLYYLLIVAIIQGVTEFLPISSSGHLILLPTLTGHADQGQVIDVAVHVGTLFAVVLYFRHDAPGAPGCTVITKVVIHYKTAGRSLGVSRDSDRCGDGGR